MTRAIARIRTLRLDRQTAAEEIARSAIVCLCGMALVMAGAALPF